MAEALWRLRNGRTRLLTALGDDADGQYLADIAPTLLLDGCTVKGAHTPTYAAVLDSRGQCRLGLGDMALHNHITTDLVNKHINVLEKAPLVILDGNVPQSTMDHVLQLCHDMKKPVFFEPTDRRKAVKFLRSHCRITFASPNLSELRAMAAFLRPDLNLAKTDDLTEIEELSIILSKYVNTLIITIGERGVIIVRNTEKYESGYNNIRGRLYPVEVLDNIESVSGAGDCFASGFIYGMLQGLNESQCVSIGIKTAKSALLSKYAVPPKFCLNYNL